MLNITSGAISLPSIQDTIAAKEKVISFWSLDSETRTFQGKIRDSQELSSQSFNMSSAGKSTRSGSKFNVIDLQEYASSHAIKKELANTPKASNPKVITTRGKSAKKRKTDELIDALSSIQRQFEDFIAEKFSEIHASFESRNEETEQLKLDLQKISLAKDRKMASLDKEINMLQKEAILAQIAAQKEVAEVIEEAKHSAAVAMLKIKLQMAKEAMDPAFDRFAWEVDAWKERLAELEEEGVAEEGAGDGAGGSGVKDAEGADAGKESEKAAKA